PRADPASPRRSMTSRRSPLAWHGPCTLLLTSVSLAARSGESGGSPMKRRVIHPMRLRVGLAIAMGWPAAGVIAEGATARSDPKNANGVKVGEASLQDTTEGAKLSATFTDLDRTASWTVTARASWFTSEPMTT